MLAIPVFRARVSPVLDWCSKIMIFSEKGTDLESHRQVDVTEKNVLRLMQNLREQGIETLICGALSPETLDYGESIGMKIIHGIAGEIEEVLQAYRERKLDQPKYWLPGCRGQRRCKGGEKCGEGKNSITGGPGGYCICPECGSRKKHERGIPCSQLRCSTCDSSMTRE